MKVDIRNPQDKVRLSESKILRCARAALKSMSEDKAELGLLFVDDSYIKRLNWKYRKVNSRTDVLAFAMREGQGLPKDSQILGDVVISAETAKREAKNRGIALQDELNLYVVHGVLHLLGYDDENPRERKKMRAKEKEILSIL